MIAAEAFQVFLMYTWVIISGKDCWGSKKLVLVCDILYYVCSVDWLAFPYDYVVIIMLSYYFLSSISTSGLCRINEVLYLSTVCFSLNNWTRYSSSVDLLMRLIGLESQRFPGITSSSLQGQWRGESGRFLGSKWEFECQIPWDFCSPF